MTDTEPLPSMHNYIYRRPSRTSHRRPKVKTPAFTVHIRRRDGARRHSAVMAVPIASNRRGQKSAAAIRIRPGGEFPAHVSFTDRLVRYQPADASVMCWACWENAGLTRLRERHLPGEKVQVWHTCLQPDRDPCPRCLWSIRRSRMCSLQLKLLSERRPETARCSMLN
jgi:hypothetical protein